MCFAAFRFLIRGPIQQQQLVSDYYVDREFGPSSPPLPLFMLLSLLIKYLSNASREGTQKLLYKQPERETAALHLLIGTCLHSPCKGPSMYCD